MFWSSIISFTQSDVASASIPAAVVSTGIEPKTSGCLASRCPSKLEDVVDVTQRPLGSVACGLDCGLAFLIALAPTCGPISIVGVYLDYGTDPFVGAKLL